MPRVVISGASPLHYLILIENAEVLQALYTEVLIPEAVAKELKQTATPESVRHWIEHPPLWLHVVPFTAPPTPNCALALNVRQKAAAKARMSNLPNFMLSP